MPLDALRVRPTRSVPVTFGGADERLTGAVPITAGDFWRDLPRIAAILKRAKPDIRMMLELITRDPLKVPCLTDKFWATMPQVSGKTELWALNLIVTVGFIGITAFYAGLAVPIRRWMLQGNNGTWLNRGVAILFAVLALTFVMR